MKYLLISLLLVMDSFMIAQDLHISFSAQGATTELDSIVATNLTTKESVTIPGNETLTLHSVTTGINTLYDGSDIHVFPNPYRSYTNVNIQNSDLQKVTVTLFDLSGTSINLFEQTLSKGTHVLKVSAKMPGIYILSIETSSGISSKKIVQTVSGENRIEYLTMSSSKTILKSEKADYVLNYLSGNVLSYNLMRGDMSTVVNETPTISRTINATLVECKDIDGNNYPVVKIGDQIWMAENLVTTRYADGTQIPIEKRNYIWKLIESNNTEKYYCFVNNDWNGEKDIYGALYTFGAAVNGIPQADSSDVVQGVCPNGWHLPSKYEWNILGDYLIANGYNYDNTTIGNKIGKSLAASSERWSLNTLAGTIGNDVGHNNRSGFSGLPAGQRNPSTGQFLRIGTNTYFWTSTEYDSTGAASCSLGSITTGLTHYYSGEKSFGFSVRCVKD